VNCHCFHISENLTKLNPKDCNRACEITPSRPRIVHSAAVIFCGQIPNTRGQLGKVNIYLIGRRQ
jgi:hypothetical protein